MYSSSDRDLTMVSQIYQPMAAELREKLQRSFFFARQHFASAMHKRIEEADEARLQDFMDLFVMLALYLNLAMWIDFVFCSLYSVQLNF